MTPPKLRWADLYREADLYKAAVHLYTKVLFQWRKALSTSPDGKTLYDFARHGMRNLEGLHRELAAGRFKFEPGIARVYNFNGKSRTLYLYPWKERLVDLLLYRLLSRRLDRSFSSRSFAYRYRGYGVDFCQARIAAEITRLPRPFFVVKRDIADYFGSIDHETLVRQLESRVDLSDPLGRMLMERVRFRYEQQGLLHEAQRGVPFGTSIACFFANLYLTGLDSEMEKIPGLTYFRYADDLLAFAEDPETALRAADCCEQVLRELRLALKPSQSVQYLVSEEPARHPLFARVDRFKHLGLQFRADGLTGLSRDKARKISNLFRYAFRRKAGRFRKLASPERRAALAVEIAGQVITGTVRQVAIIDYYLRHVRDEAQLRLLDRWLAEEVLSLAFRNGHRKGNFRRLSYRRLREMGLPSLLHRGRMIRHGQVRTSFFQWKQVPKLGQERGGWRQARRAFSPNLEAAADVSS